MVYPTVAVQVLLHVNDSQDAPRIALSAAFVTGAIIAEIAVLIGYRLRVRFTILTARRVDGTVGAL